MDPNQSLNQPVVPPNPIDPGVAESPDKKKLLIIVGAGAVIILGFIAVVLFQSSQPPKKEGGSSEQKSQTSKNVGGQLPTKVPSSTASPESVALGYYHWFVSRPAPISSGEWEKRDDLSAEGKEIIRDWVAQEPPEKRDSIYQCGYGSLPDKLVSAGVEYDNNKNKAIVTLQDPSTEQNLFEFIMSAKGGSASGGEKGSVWQVQDVWCTP